MDYLPGAFDYPCRDANRLTFWFCKHEFMIVWLFKLGIQDQLYVGLLFIVSVALMSRYRTISYNLKPLLWLCLLHLGIELLADYLHFAFTPSIENVFLYHLLTPLDYSLLALVFYRTFTDPNLQRGVVWSVAVYWGIAVFFTLYNGPFDQVNTLAFMAESLLVTFWCFMFFRSLLNRDDGFIPEKDPTFWIIVAVLFYFVGNFFIYGSLNYFYEDNVKLGQQIYHAGYAFYYLLYGTIGVTCLLNFPVRTHE